MATNSLESYKQLISDLYNENQSNEEIKDFLRQRCVDTTIFEIHNHLEKWHLVPTPSPVLTSNYDPSGDSDDDRKALRRHDNVSQLSVTCHHGTYSHISLTRPSSNANFSSALDPLELYQQDEQSHAELAYNLQLDPDELEYSVEDNLAAARIDHRIALDINICRNLRVINERKLGVVRERRAIRLRARRKQPSPASRPASGKTSNSVSATVPKRQDRLKD